MTEGTADALKAASSVSPEARMKVMARTQTINTACVKADG